MKIILLKDHKELGKKGQMVESKDGFARNFLFPRKIAIEATPENVANWEVEQAKLREEERIALEKAMELKKEIEGKTIKFQVKSGNTGKLFGSITSQEISKALKGQGKLDIDKKKIELKDPIKTSGLHEVTIRVYPEVTAQLKVQVESV